MFYSDLPPNIELEYVNRSLRPVKKEKKKKRDKSNKKKQYVEAFLKRTLPFSRQKQGEIQDLLYKTQTLDNVKQKKVNVTNKRHRKTLTAREKRDLKLFHINLERQTFEQYLPLNKLWASYIQQTVNLSSMSKTNSETMERLLKADYHGCYLTVKKSKCPSYVGISGIVLQETRNMFKMITSDNTVKSIPKANSIFAFEIGAYCFTIHGNHFRIAAGERSHKKFKQKPTIDL
ncbi:hypothetical protein CHS0354_034788 [Potamilus streckersoni]|uniref:Ribonuclease P protein subunit p29 n=1 Tax=Potamilus streckersoni TaxID=2493646 RepID=A0AAE0RSP5_9BIVA|nr:hypothetical protein CHS0354_034788 [Potamilus streckersoni]